MNKTMEHENRKCAKWMVSRDLLSGTLASGYIRV